MKKISAFRSRDGMKFVLSSLIVIIIAFVFIFSGFEYFYDYLFVVMTSYYIIALLYYNYID